jgi:hypothetical protein
MPSDGNAGAIGLRGEEGYLSLSEASKELPCCRAGRPVHPSTLARWIATGARAKDGTNVRLEAHRLGGSWVTSRSALVRFAARLACQGSDYEKSVIDASALKGRNRTGDVLDAIGIR